MSSGPDQPVTVVLADQRPLVDRAVRAGAQRVRQFSVVNGFAATEYARGATTASRSTSATATTPALRQQARGVVSQPIVPTSTILDS